MSEHPRGIAGPLAALALGALLASLAGCGGSRPSGDAPMGAGAAAALAQQVAEHHRGAATLRADYIALVKPKQGESRSFSVNVWTRGSDGLTFVKASKLGYDFCDALVRPDGTFTAVLLVDPRSVVEGRLGDLLSPGGDRPAAQVGGNAALFVDEARRGPLPGVQAWTGRGRTLQALDPATGLEARIEIAPGQPEALRKTWFAGDGTELVSIAYSRYKQLDGLHRPTWLELSMPGWDGTIVLSLRDLDVLPSVSDERMTLTPPKDLKRMPVREFVDLIQQ